MVKGRVDISLFGLYSMSWGVWFRFIGFFGVFLVSRCRRSSVIFDNWVEID